MFPRVLVKLHSVNCVFNRLKLYPNPVPASIFVCLFVSFGFYVQLENFSFLWRRHYYREMLKISTILGTYDHWAVMGSLAYHTFCTRGHLFIKVIFENSWYPQLPPSVWQWSCQYLSLRYRSVAAGIRTPDLPHARRTLLPTAPASISFLYSVTQTGHNMCKVWQQVENVLLYSQSPFSW